jgi:hypothetical protein
VIPADAAAAAAAAVHLRMLLDSLRLDCYRLILLVCSSFVTYFDGLQHTPVVPHGILGIVTDTCRDQTCLLHSLIILGCRSREKAVEYIFGVRDFWSHTIVVIPRNPSLHSSF